MTRSSKGLKFFNIICFRFKKLMFKKLIVKECNDLLHNNRKLSDFIFKISKTFKSKKIEKRKHLLFYTSVKNYHFLYLNR